jgi:hypothetical protein
MEEEAGGFGGCVGGKEDGSEGKKLTFRLSEEIQ